MAQAAGFALGQASRLEASRRNAARRDANAQRQVRSGASLADSVPFVMLILLCTRNNYHNAPPPPKKKLNKNKQTNNHSNNSSNNPHLPPCNLQAKANDNHADEVGRIAKRNEAAATGNFVGAGHNYTSRGLYLPL